MKALIPMLGLLAGAAFAAHADPAPMAPTAQGVELAAKLDAMDVEHKWLARQRVDWRTGLPNGDGEIFERGHTHCSAFVAAAAQALGIYILHPPEHSAKLLANAQSDWLAEAGAAAGWRPVADMAAAQDAANAGQFVVAVYKSHRADTSGHIVIVRPAARSALEGPLVVQAGTVNNSALPLRDAFAGHPAAWRDHEIRFYSHPL